MASSQPRLRARDTDRSTTEHALDNAYADGQLGFDEHNDRVARARSAKTLGDLHALIADLQIDVDLPEPAAPAPSRRRVVIAAAVVLVVVVVVAIVAATLLARNDDNPPNAAPPSSSSPSTSVAQVVPIVAPTVDFGTAAGLASFRGEYIARFGDALVDSVTFFPRPDAEYAAVTRAVRPDLAQSYSYRGGFDPSGKPEAREAGAQSVDLQTVDFDRIAGLMAGLPETVGLPGAEVSHLTIAADDGPPTVTMYATNTANKSGYLKATVTGDILRVYRPS